MIQQASTSLIVTQKIFQYFEKHAKNRKYILSYTDLKEKTVTSLWVSMCMHNSFSFSLKLSQPSLKISSFSRDPSIFFVLFIFDYVRLDACVRCDKSHTSLIRQPISPLSPSIVKVSRRKVNIIALIDLTIKTERGEHWVCVILFVRTQDGGRAALKTQEVHALSLSIFFLFLIIISFFFFIYKMFRYNAVFSHLFSSNTRSLPFLITSRRPFCRFTFY